MKIVEEENQLESLFLTAKSEAKSFSIMMNYILRSILNPRHIEVQIMSVKIRLFI